MNLIGRAGQITVPASEKIAVLEDTDILREVIVEALKREFGDKVEISEYERSKDLLSAIQEGLTPSLIVSDLNVLDTNAEQTIATLRKIKKEVDTKVIVFSSDIGFNEKVDFLLDGVGVDGAVNKDKGIAKLLENASRVLKTQPDHFLIGRRSATRTNEFKI